MAACSLTLRVAQRFFDEPGSRGEMLAEVKGRDVLCLHAVVDDVHVAVVTGSGVHVVPRPLCCVQDVRNPQPFQIVLVLCGLPGEKEGKKDGVNIILILYCFFYSVQKCHTFLTHSSPMYTLGQTSLT